MERVIPGDPDYVRGTVVDDIAELVARLDEVDLAFNELDENAQAIARVVTALGLTDETAGLRETRELTDLAERLLERISVISANVLKIAGITIESEETADRALELGDETDEGSAEDVLQAQPVTRPSQLKNTPDESAKRQLGSRIFTLTEDEIKQAYPDQSGITVVSLCDEGTGLLYAPDGGTPIFAADLHELVIRGVNMYNRLVLAGVTDFKKSDVDELFGPEHGFNNLVDVVRRTNSVLTKKLGVDPLFTDNGEDRQKRRYTPTDQVLFIG